LVTRPIELLLPEPHAPPVRIPPDQRRRIEISMRHDRHSRDRESRLFCEYAAERGGAASVAVVVASFGALASGYHPLIQHAAALK
jgi:hypothetical protein